VEPAPVITLDTSAVIALLNERDRDHRSVTDALRADSQPFLVPAETLGEVSYFIADRLGPQVLDLFVADLVSGDYSLDCDEGRLARMRDLIRQYADLPLGLVDAAVIACAEDNGGRVLTLDRRAVGAVAHEGRITVLP
jgi:predicted nucleic acid-binding protein